MIKSRMIKWVGYVVQMGRRGVPMDIGGNPEGKRPLGRVKRWWVNNIKKDLREIGWCGMD
jgi:hypothetical protein